ncbi:hypothetical protein M426DRAFT_187156 [Hypoxylon sp. CI-4A]|nr:hypothetical protein M426DRAFT_187156 [Hypoxylon sp. CI-4A]
MLGESCVYERRRMKRPSFSNADVMPCLCCHYELPPLPPGLYFDPPWSSCACRYLSAKRGRANINNMSLKTFGLLGSPSSYTSIRNMIGIPMHLMRNRVFVTPRGVFKYCSSEIYR